MELSEIRFGVEIEFYNLTKPKADSVLKSCLEGSKSINSYKFIERYKGRDWTITADRSLHNTVDEPKPYKQQFCGEFITPILTLKDLPLLINIVNKLDEAGAKSDAAHGCSVHVHVDVSHLKTKDLIHICRQHNKIYDDIYEVFNLTRTQRDTFAKKLPKAFMDSLSETMTPTQLKESWYRNCNKYVQDRTTHYNKSRYHAVNLHSMYEGRGIEYRYFKFYTKLDSELLEAIVLYSLHMSLPSSKIFSSLDKLLADMFKDDPKYIDILLNQFPCKVEAATKEDLDKIYNLYIERVDWFKKKNIKQWSTYTKDYPKSSFEVLVDKELLYKVIINDEIIGAFELSRSSKIWDSKDNALYLWRFVTKVGTRGIGRKIIDFCIKECKKQNTELLRTFNLAKNKKLEAIFDEYGFKTAKYYDTKTSKFSLRELKVN